MSKKSVSILMPTELDFQMRVVAAHEGLNPSQLIRKLVQEYVSEHPVAQFSSKQKSEDKHKDLLSG